MCWNSNCGLSEAWKRGNLDSLVVEHDIWRPDLGGGRAHLLNAAELVWIPAQQDVVPALQHTHVHMQYM